MNEEELLKMRKGWLLEENATLQEVLMVFLDCFPMLDQSKLNGRSMRRLLSGEWVPVKPGKPQTFIITTFPEMVAQRRGHRRIRPLPKEGRTEALAKMCQDLNIIEPLRLVGGIPK